MLGWAVGDNAPLLWDVEEHPFDMPPELVPFLIEGTGTIRAHNAPFEIAILGHTIGIQINLNQWQCSQVLSYSLSFAGGLGQILQAIGMPSDKEKDTRGTKLIQKFCKPAPSNHKATIYDRHSNPEDWADFEEYCLQDVVVLRELWKWCDKYHPVSEREWARWRQDREINQRGLPIDYPLVNASIAAMDGAKVALKDSLKELTGLPLVTNGPLLVWLNANGCTIPNMQRASKEKALAAATDPTVQAVLEAHLLLAQASSSSKWNALDNRGDHDAGVIRETIQFVGAGRTGRAAGRGLQLQNLKRSPADMDANIAHILTGAPATMDQISSSIRGAIKAPEGKRLVVSDLSSIESRVVGWLTNCELINSTFNQGLDTYRVLACRLFNVEYHDVTKEQRTFAKPAALGCQYMLGGKGLVAYADNYGVALIEAEAKVHVKTYRAIYPELPGFWQWIKDAIFYVLQYQINKAQPVEGYYLKLYIEGEFLFIDLPSGRRLNYFRPEIVKGPAPWDPERLINKFQFMGMSQYTQQWQPITAHAGGILENIIQALARDILYVWLERAEEAGHVILGSVHDEIITVIEEPRTEAALANLNALAAQPIDWAPGLNLDAAGYISERYRKD